MQKGVAWPNPRFTDNTDGTVTDNLTGLFWLKDANCIKTQYSSFDSDGTAGDGAVSWQHALDFVEGINAGTYPFCGAGQTDWRLPNVREMHSLIDYTDAATPRCRATTTSLAFSPTTTGRVPPAPPIRTHSEHPTRAILGPGLLLGLIVALLAAGVALAAGHIDSTDGWAWGTNMGWINFNPANGDVTVYSDHLEGYA